jgi:hypothetical protein
MTAYCKVIYTMTLKLDIRIRNLLAKSFHSEVPRGWAGDSHLNSIYGKTQATGIQGCGDCHLSFVSGFCWQIHSHTKNGDRLEQQSPFFVWIDNWL